MAKVTMPQLGESVAEGTIGKWLKQPGDHVAKYEPLLEVITDKVNAEVPSPFEGVLKEILAEEGATVPNNAEIAIIETADDGATDAAATGPIVTSEPASAAAPAAAAAPADRPGRLRRDEPRGGHDAVRPRQPQPRPHHRHPRLLPRPPWQLRQRPQPRLRRRQPARATPTRG